MFESLQFETDIIWLEDPTSLAYVREGIIVTSGRTRRPQWWHPRARLVGYANLSPEIRRARGIGTYERRMFWLKEHDRDRDPYGVFARRVPAEAVDPQSIRPGAPSRPLWGEQQ